jgi:4-amino-4-deoxy-L-arabinose transferase-like glycosyltransferase
LSVRHPTFDTPSRWSVRAALALVLGLAVMLRFWAIDWGAPYVYHPDEHLVLHPALDIVRDGDLNPHWFQYPSLLIYLQAGIVAAAQPFVRAPLTTDPVLNHIGPWDVLRAQWPFALGGRLAVAAFAVAGIWLLYSAGARYGAAPLGMAAALFLTASVLHNESSHYLTTDVPATTLLTGALLFSIAAAQSLGTQKEPRQLAAAGLCAGLAAATKYTAGIVLLVPLFVALSSSLRLSVRRGALIVGAAAIGFLVACPFVLFDFPAVWGGILEQRHNYLRGYNPGGNWRWYLEYLYWTGLGRPGAIACALGLFYALIRSVADRTWAGRRLHLAFVIVPVVYFAVISSYPSRAERNLIILLPFLCLMGAAVCWRSAQLWRQQNAATVVFIIGVLLMGSPGISASISWDRQRTFPDTRALALQWIDSHLPAGSRIAREQYTPQVPDARLHVTYVWSLAWRDYAWYLDQGTDYLVVSSNVYNRALQPPYVGGVAGPGFYRFIFDHLPLMAEFVPGIGTSGPTIRIYQVPHG